MADELVGDGGGGGVEAAVVWAEAVAQWVAAYGSGVLAAGSPCAVVLVPLTLYRFRSGDHGWPFVAFLVGFLLSYAVLGLFAQQLLASPVQQGIKAGLGGVFMLLGAAGARGAVDAISLPMQKNTFVLGAVYALLVSVNPCTLPFLGVLLSTGSRWMFVDLIAFAAGLATPATLFVLLGKTSLSWFRSQGRALAALNTVMNGVLVLTGIYVILQERLYTSGDVLVAAALTALASVVLWRTNLSRLGHARLTAVAVLACNIAPLVPFIINSHSALHPQDGSSAIGKCPARTANDYLCRACYVYAALHVGGAVMLCLHLAVTGVLTDRRADAALARFGTGSKRPLHADLAASGIPSLPL